MKRAGIFVSVVVACSLAAVGCSSAESSSSTPSPNAASSPQESQDSAASSAAATSDTASGGSQTSDGPASSDADGTTTDGSAAAPTDGGTAPELDAPTFAWFDTFCAGLAPIATLDLSDQVNSGPTDAPDPTDPDNAIQKQTLVSAITAAAGAFGQTSQALATQALPTFDGGAEYATAAASGLGAAGDQIAAAVTIFDAVPAGATDAYWTAKSALRTQALAALAPLQSLAEPPAAVQGGVSQIPSCQALGL